MADTIELLESTRPDYGKELLWHKLLLDAYTGGGGFQGATKQPASSYWGPNAEAYANRLTLVDGSLLRSTEVDTYLERYPREDEDKFQRRVDSAHYPNYIKPLTDLKLSFIFRREFMIENLPEPLAQWASDMDGHGASFYEHIQCMALTAATLGWLPVVVDMPRVDREVLTQAHAEELGLLPRVVPLLPANLLDYSLDEDGEFVWAKIRTEIYDNPSPFAQARCYHRYTIWHRDRFEIYEIEQDSSGVKRVKQITAEGGEAHGFGKVPVLIMRHAKSPSDSIKGLPMHGQESIEAKALFNRISELDEHLRGQVFAILVLARGNSEQAGEIKIGVDNAINIDPNSTQSHQYISPDPSIAATYEKRIEATITEIYRMARVEFARSSASPISGIARRFEFAQTNRALSDAAKPIARFMKQALVMVGRLKGISEEVLQAIRITPPRDFDVEDLQEELKNALDAKLLDLGATANRLMKKRAIEQLIPNLGEEDKKMVEQELLALAERDENEDDFDEEMKSTASTPFGQDDESEDEAA